jgi:OHCU decarboxylase
MTLEDANRLERTEFVWALGWVFEDSPWVAERAWASRPFASVSALHQVMVDIVEHASPDEQLALLRAHPDLGTRAHLSAASAGEQHSAGLDALPTGEFESLQMFNRQYCEKFGFPFIYAVKGSGKEDVLLALTLRLNSTPEEELHQALWEVGRIAWFRLQEMFT